MHHLGLLGGTFDPIHEGHLRAARAAMQFAHLSGVVFMPTANPPHKRAIAPARDRFEMARLALAPHAREGFSLSRIEMDTEGMTYTCDTLRLLHEQMPGTRFSYIVGEDMLPRLAHWKGLSGVTAYCEFLACPREPPSALPPLPDGVRVRRVPMTPVCLSSTAIRERLQSTGDAEGLAPDVRDYILRNSLYVPPMEERVAARMDEARFAHTLGVRDTAVELARRHGVDAGQASLAGLLHDVAKCLPLADMQRVAREHALTDDPFLLSRRALLHGLVGAQIARTQFGVREEAVLDAIRFHTTGRADMTRLDMLIYLADMIEPTRKPFPGLTHMRAVALDNLEAATLLAMESTVQYVRASGKPLCAGTLLAMEWLQKKIKEVSP